MSKARTLSKIVVPDPAVADTYLRRNAANTGHDAKTPLQVADELIAVRDWRGRNVLINGDMRVWQEGTSFTITATRYTAEGWLYYAGGGTPSATVSQQPFVVGQVDVPGEPEFFLRIAQTAAATTIEPSFTQRIEGVRTLAGQTVTRSVWLRVQSGTLSLVPQIKQHFGTGGSPSADVSVSQSAITVTTAWQRFPITLGAPSIAGKTLGSDGNDYLELVLRPPLSQTFTLDIADIQLEPGSVATPFERRPIGEVLALCQRYFMKSMNGTPAHGVSGGTGSGAMALGITGRQLYSHVHFPVEMRTNPTITFYGYGGATSGVWRDTDNNADGPVASALNTGRMSFIARTADNVTADRHYIVHYTANSRL